MHLVLPNGEYQRTPADELLANRWAGLLSQAFTAAGRHFHRKEISRRMFNRLPGFATAPLPWNEYCGVCDCRGSCTTEHRLMGSPLLGWSSLSDRIPPSTELRGTTA